MSKEPRPVYAAELDVLGFDAYWKYARQNEVPYLWAEANCYYYRGQMVAKLKGGDVVTATISMNAIAELGLEVGKEAYAVIKATSVMVGVDHHHG